MCCHYPTPRATIAATAARRRPHTLAGRGRGEGLEMGGGERGRASGETGRELGRERGRAAGYQIRSDVIAEQISTYLAT